MRVAVTGGFGRRADRAFVQALVEHGHVDLNVLDERVDRLPDTVTEPVRHTAREIVASMRRGDRP